jgi:hypothetical protein
VSTLPPPAALLLSCCCPLAVLQVKGKRRVLLFDPTECFTLEMGEGNTRIIFNPKPCQYNPPSHRATQLPPPHAHRHTDFDVKNRDQSSYPFADSSSAYRELFPASRLPSSVCCLWRVGGGCAEADRCVVLCAGCCCCCCCRHHLLHAAALCPAHVRARCPVRDVLGAVPQATRPVGVPGLPPAGVPDLLHAGACAWPRCDGRDAELRAPEELKSFQSIK